MCGLSSVIRKARSAISLFGQFIAGDVERRGDAFQVGNVFFCQAICHKSDVPLIPSTRLGIACEKCLASFAVNDTGSIGRARLQREQQVCLQRGNLVIEVEMKKGRACKE